MAAGHQAPVGSAEGSLNPKATGDLARHVNVETRRVARVVNKALGLPAGVGGHHQHAARPDAIKGVGRLGDAAEDQPKNEVQQG